MRACDQSSVFSTGGKFCPDYGLLLELHALTLVARSYALLSLVCIPPNCAIYPDPSKVFINTNWPSFTAGLAVDHWNSDSESLEKFITGPTNTLQCCHQCQTRIWTFKLPLWRYIYIYWLHNYNYVAISARLEYKYLNAFLLLCKVIDIHI